MTPISFPTNPQEGQEFTLSPQKRYKFNNGVWRLYRQSMVNNAVYVDKSPVQSETEPTLPTTNLIWIKPSTGEIFVQKTVNGNTTWQPVQSPLPEDRSPVISDIAPVLPSIRPFWIKPSTGEVYTQVLNNGVTTWQLVKGFVPGDNDPVSSESAPTLPNDSTVWIKPSTGQLYVQKTVNGTTSWHEVTSASMPDLSPILSEATPALPSDRLLWLKASTGQLYVQKQVTDATRQWVLATASTVFPVDKSPVVSETAPDLPNDASVWVKQSTGEIYVKKKVSSVESWVKPNDLTTAVSNLQTAMQTAQSDILSLQTSVSNLSGLSGRVTTAESDIDDLQSSLAQTNSQVSSLSVNKQDKLVDGQSLKTINGQSLQGQGNITISGGGGDSAAKLDAMSWELGTFPTTSTCYGGAYFDDKFFAFVDNVIYTSPNGLTNWVSHPVSGFSRIYSMCKHNGLYVVGTLNNGIYTSPDLITWTQVQISAGLTVGVVRSNGTVCLGVSGNFIFRSTDGITWEKLTVASQVEDVAYGNNIWLTCSAYGDASLMSTDNGLTWVSTGRTMFCWSIVYQTGKFFAFGRKDQSSYVCTTGTDWKQAIVTVGFTDWGKPGADEGVVINLGTDNKMMISHDCENWETRATPTTGNWSKVVIGGGRILLLPGGSYGTCAVSTSRSLPNNPGRFCNVTELLTDLTITSNVLDRVTELCLGVAANAIYEIDALITFQSSATTTGLNLGLTSPTNAENHVEIVVPVLNTATAGALRTTFPNSTVAANAGNVVGTGVSATNNNHTARISGIIRTRANSGECRIQCASEVNGSAITLKAGSVLKLRRVG